MRENIERMQRLADEHGIRVRPHVKTHKCVEIAKLQRQAGAIGFTAGKLGEAEVFADTGCNEATGVPGRGRPRVQPRR